MRGCELIDASAAQRERHNYIVIIQKMDGRQTRHTQCAAIRRSSEPCIAFTTHRVVGRNISFEPLMSSENNFVHISPTNAPFNGLTRSSDIANHTNLAHEWPWHFDRVRTLYIGKVLNFTPLTFSQLPLFQGGSRGGAGARAPKPKWLFLQT